MSIVENLNVEVINSHQEILDKDVVLPDREKELDSKEADEMIVPGH